MAAPIQQTPQVPAILSNKIGTSGTGNPGLTPPFSHPGDARHVLLDWPHSDRIRQPEGECTTLPGSRTGGTQLLSRARPRDDQANNPGHAGSQPPSKARDLHQTVTYDHTHWKIRDPVRSPIDKPVRARLVVGSVTTSESLVLYVFFCCCPFDPYQG